MTPLYKNPILPGFHPDPSMCRVGEDYYLVTSSFEYFPGVPIFHSRDLVNWRAIGHCLTRPSQLPLDTSPASCGIFAPTLRYHRGTFYMITTNVTQGGHFYVTATDPAGQWSEPIWINAPGIDPSLFFDEDGLVYFTYTSDQIIHQSIIDIATGKLLTEPCSIWSGTGGKYPEGPHLYKINGLYYLLTAEGGTEYGHFVTMARSDSPWGPFEACPHNPILTHRGLDHPIQGVGHADLFPDQHGAWWMVCLGFRPVGYPPCYHLGRETFLTPVTWTEDGWPVVKNGRVELEMAAPSLAAHPWTKEPARDDFDAPSLRLQWNFLRHPKPETWSPRERPGWLRLKGSAITLDEETASPTWIGRRQEHFDCQMTARLDFHLQQDGDEAGLVLWMNERHHYDLAVTQRDGQRCIILRRRIGSLAAITTMEPIRDGLVTLSIQADPKLYHFSYTVGDQPVRALSGKEGETRYLSTEVGGKFTGVYVAMYATGTGQPSQSPADFDWFEYQPL